MGPAFTGARRQVLKLFEDRYPESTYGAGSSLRLEPLREALEVVPAGRWCLQGESGRRVSGPGRHVEFVVWKLSRAGALDEELGLALEVKAARGQAARGVT